jgi:hypothetical protein
MSKSILVFDPGESTGWCFQDRNGIVCGGTARKNHLEVANLIKVAQPDIVVLERFNLYPQMAKSLSWNSFYPCETIGVIKVVCMELGIPIVEQAPGIKKYFGGFQKDWETIGVLLPMFEPFSKGVTEHTKDAYMHYKYFLRNGLKKFV